VSLIKAADGTYPYSPLNLY